ncbi:MAG: class I SAM-dependent methyltransferase [Saprospiraceae bacterium]|nr:class I SAM-dependent methyltransferase [Saprospiraceae bacterium]
MAYPVLRPGGPPRYLATQTPGYTAPLSLVPAMAQPPFDAVADAYDRQFTHTEVGRRQRNIVLACLETLLRPGDEVLELNGGTGEDALWLARQGCRVLSTDLSPGMVAVAAAKAQQAGLTHQIQTQVLDMRQLAPAAVGGPFDLILSDFGGLNCLSPAELQQLNGVLPALLKPGGLLVAVVMGRFCWWESLYFFAKGKFRTALRRQSKMAVPARLNADQNVDTWYYSPAETCRLFAGLEPQDIQPVGFWLPPSYLDPWFARRRGWLNLLDRLEKKCRSRHWARAADHFLIVFKNNRG